MVLTPSVYMMLMDVVRYIISLCMLYLFCSIGRHCIVFQLSVCSVDITLRCEVVYW